MDKIRFLTASVIRYMFLLIVFISTAGFFVEFLEHFGVSIPFISSAYIFTFAVYIICVSPFIAAFIVALGCIKEKNYKVLLFTSLLIISMIVPVIINIYYK